MGKAVGEREGGNRKNCCQHHGYEVKVILNLENRDLFDDVTVLFGLYGIMDKFYKKFMTAFRK